MRLHLEIWDAHCAASATDELAFEALPLAIDCADAPHAEDAFLSDFARFARERDTGEHAPRIRLELARAALDAIEDVDGIWQTLAIEPWLDGLACAPDAIAEDTLVLLARAFVDFLGDSGRLSLHGQRLLTRRIARWRRHFERVRATVAQQELPLSRAALAA